MKTLVVAMDHKNAIGQDDDLPWRRGLKDDLSHFKQLTVGTSVIMGRKTFESIGFRPLPDRENIVVTSNPTGVQGVLSALSLKAAYALARYPIMIIGGGRIFDESIDDADELVVTHVDAEFPSATVFFPEIDEKIWQDVACQHYEADERNEYSFDIVTYRRAIEL